MFSKPYWVDRVFIRPDSSSRVRIVYLHKQSGTPAAATVTGVTAGTGTFVSATSERPDDTTDFEVVYLEFTATPTVDVAYCKNEFSVVHDD